MNAIIGALGISIILAELIGGILCLISVPTLGGYFFVRVVLKVLGLHSGTTEEVKNEIKLAVGCCVLVLFTFVLALMGSWMAGD